MKSFTVFGHPIQHSKSPRIHQLFAAQLGIELQYDKALVPLDGFEQAVHQFFFNGGFGANVTLPFKLRAYALSQQLTERAKCAGAVNTLIKNEKGELVGDNTDGIGLILDLQRLNLLPNGSKVLLIGAGGAAQGVIAPLYAAGAEITLTNRSMEKALDLSQQFIDTVDMNCLSFDQLEGLGFDLVINATSSSVDNQVPEIPFTVFVNSKACYDMFYQKDLTAFLLKAQQYGVTELHDGLGMLVAQAAHAFSLWHQQLPQIAPVIVQLREELN